MSSNRAKEFLLSVPLVTMCLLVFNVAIHLILFVTSFDSNILAIRPALVLYGHEYYRVITSTFVHGGILHILMNMSTLLPMGGSLEKRFGTLKFILFTIWTIFLDGFIYVTLTWMYSKITNDPGQMYGGAVGYSGVLFAYMVVECWHATEQSRSVFGCFNVPTKVYPFILLVLLSVIVPNISFTGHLSGILSGLFLMSNVGYNLCFPSNECLDALERTNCWHKCYTTSSYVILKDVSLIHPSLDISAATSGGGNSSTGSGGCCTQCSALVGTVGGFIGMVLTQIKNLLFTVLFIVGCPVDSFQQKLDHCGAGVKWFVCSVHGAVTTCIASIVDKVYSMVTGGATVYSAVSTSEQDDTNEHQSNYNDGGGSNNSNNISSNASSGDVEMGRKLGGGAPPSTVGNGSNSNSSGRSAAASAAGAAAAARFASAEKKVPVVV